MQKLENRLDSTRNDIILLDHGIKQSFDLVHLGPQSGATCSGVLDFHVNIWTGFLKISEIRQAASKRSFHRSGGDTISGAGSPAESVNPNVAIYAIQIDRSTHAPKGMCGIAFLVAYGKRQGSILPMSDYCSVFFQRIVFGFGTVAVFRALSMSSARAQSSLDTDGDGIPNDIESAGCFYTATEANAIAKITSSLTRPDGDQSVGDIQYAAACGGPVSRAGSIMKNVMMAVLMAVVAFLATLGTVQAQTNLVKNGSFENTVITTGFRTVGVGQNFITDWSVVSGNVDQIFTFWPAQHGRQSIDMGGTVAGTLQQTVTGLQIGSTYTLNFYYNKHSQIPSTTTVQMRVEMANLNALVSHLGAFQWRLATYTFTATSTTHTLRFTQISPTGSAGMALDNVSIVVDLNRSATLVKSAKLNDGGDGRADQGDQVNYTFTVKNTGNVELTGVALNDPIGSSPGSFSGTGGLAQPVFDASQSTTGATATSIPVGGSAVFTTTYTLTQADVDAGVITNRARVIATGLAGVFSDTGTAPDGATIPNPLTTDSDGDGINDNDPTVLVLTQNPAFTLVKTADTSNWSKPVQVGEMITYTFTVENTGNVTQNNIVVSDLLIDESDPIATIAALAPGATGSVTATYALKQSDINAGEVRNTATATSNEVAEAISSNDVIVTYDVLSDLSLEKSVDDETPDVGQNVVFTLTATNHGPSDATGVVVSEQLQDGYSFVSATASVGSYDAVLGRWMIGALANQGVATLTIEAKVLATGAYTNTASIAGNQEDSSEDNNVIDPPVEVTPIFRAPVLADDKSLDNALGKPVTVDVLDNDTAAEGRTLEPTTVELVDADPESDGKTKTVPGEGVWTVDPDTGEITFEPETGFTGETSPVSYTVADDQGNTSDPATVSVIYTAAPVAAADSITDAPLGTSVTIDVLANDEAADGRTLDPLTVQLVDADADSGGKVKTVPGEGVWTVDPVSGEITFTPETGFTGETTPVSYTVADDQGNPSDPATVTVIYTDLHACPDRWTVWQDQWDEELDGQTAPTDNPDGDRYSNLIDYAFCLPPNSGVGKPFCLFSSESVTGAIDGLFSRTAIGGAKDVVYTLEWTDELANPTVWTGRQVIDDNDMVVTNDGQGREIVRIVDLESFTGLTGGSGFVRIRVDLLDDQDQVVASDTTDVLGWVHTDFDLCCMTYNNPFLESAIFSGTVDSVENQDLILTTSADGVDFDEILKPGVAYYLEVEAGDFAGHRFDVVAGNEGSLMLANDSDLFALGAPFNTIEGVAPALLAGDRIALHRAKTLDMLFPPQFFGASNSRSSSDEVQISIAGQWQIFWLFNDNGTPRWVDAADSGNTDVGRSVIPPGRGMFFINRTQEISLLAFGEVREQPFANPLPAGNMLVGGGYPLDQSPVGSDSRELNLSDGFSGHRDFKIADSIFRWRADQDSTATGYETYFLLSFGNPNDEKWVLQSDAFRTSQDAVEIFELDRAVFLRVANGKSDYLVPSPWAADAP